MTHLPSLTDEELLSWFRCKRDPLTTTAMEEALAERLDHLIECDLEEVEELRQENANLQCELDDAPSRTEFEDLKHDLEKATEKIESLKKKLSAIEDIINT